MAFTLRFSALLLLSLGSAWGGSLLSRDDITCDLSDPASSGLVVLSASTPTSGSATDPTTIWFHYNLVGRSSFRDEKILIARQQLIEKVPSDFDHTFGRLYVLKLKAGDYEFRKWSFTQGRPNERTKVNPAKKSLGKLPFKVAAGRVTYLGSFSPSMVSDRELSVTVVDQGKRDMETFAKKCPTADANNINLQLLTLGLWN